MLITHRSWFRFLRDVGGPLTPDQQARVHVVFVAAKGHEELAQEQVRAICTQCIERM